MYMFFDRTDFLFYVSSDGLCKLYVFSFYVYDHNFIIPYCGGASIILKTLLCEVWPLINLTLFRGTSCSFATSSRTRSFAMFLSAGSLTETSSLVRPIFLTSSCLAPGFTLTCMYINEIC